MLNYRHNSELDGLIIAKNLSSVFRTQLGYTRAPFDLSSAQTSFSFKIKASLRSSFKLKYGKIHQLLLKKIHGQTAIFYDANGVNVAL